MFILFNLYFLFVVYLLRYIFLFTISKFVLLLHLHFFYAKTGIRQVTLADNDPTSQEFLQLLWSLEVQ
jgi:hypothetical protein